MHTAGPNGEQYCWWQCTVMGGREGRDVDAVQLAKVGLGAVLVPGGGQHAAVSPAVRWCCAAAAAVSWCALLLRCCSLPASCLPVTCACSLTPALLQAVEALGAGEILLNCIDNDGVGQGFDIDLVEAVSGEAGGE